MFRQDARSGRTNGGRSLAGAMNRSGSVHAPRRHMAHIATGIHASLGDIACRFKGERAALASVDLVSANARLRSSGSATLLSVQRLAEHLAKTVLTQSIKPPQAEVRFDYCQVLIRFQDSEVVSPLTAWSFPMMPWLTGRGSLPKKSLRTWPDPTWASAAFHLHKE